MAAFLISHAKLHSYGITSNSLKLILNYISRSNQRSNIGSSVSTWYDVITVVPQGAILGPLLLNIFVNDLFLFIKQSHVCNFAGDNTLSSCNKNLLVIFQDLVYDLKNALHWFRINSLKANPTKFQFMVLERILLSYFYVLNIDGMKTMSIDEVTLIGVFIDNKLTFKNHNDESYRRASYKFHSLCRITHFLSKEKCRLLANPFINCQFLYPPLIWMSASKSSINKICKIYFRRL